MNSKGERETFTHLNAEFQIITKSDKKAFLNGQRKLVKEKKKNRKENTRNLFKKIRDTQGNMSCKDGQNNVRNIMDLTEAEYIIRKWQKYTEKLYKKVLIALYRHDAVITHLEPEILEWEVKWATGKITVNKTIRGDGIPVKLFQILRTNVIKVKVLQSIH